MDTDSRAPAPAADATSRLRLTEREVARLISRAERDETFDGADLGLDGDRNGAGPGAVGGAHVIGVTGAPGSGKSTLVDALAREIRASGRTVAVLAVDPSSHLTGGAVLGDRVRMSSHAQDPGIYIRSMGTRGSTTGLARASRAAVRVLDAAGYDVVIVETVGVGQVELEVLTIADTVAVVLVPGLGDTMQMNKAGIMEIGDLFVVNMADRAETRAFVRELKQALALGHRHREMPPVCQTIALTGEGVDDLSRTLDELAAQEMNTPGWSERRAQQRVQELEREIERRALGKLRQLMAESPALAASRDLVASGQQGAAAAAAEWTEGLLITASH